MDTLYCEFIKWSSEVKARESVSFNCETTPVLCFFQIHLVQTSITVAGLVVVLKSMRGLKFTQRCRLNYEYSGIWHRGDWYVTWPTDTVSYSRRCYYSAEFMRTWSKLFFKDWKTLRTHRPRRYQDRTSIYRAANVCNMYIVESVNHTHSNRRHSRHLVILCCFKIN